MTEALVLQTKNLSKTFVQGFFRKKVQAIRDINLTVSRGQIFGLLGPNGAGKTTTLKILLGLVRPTAGTAEILGHPAGAPAAKRRLGYLPESPYFYDYLTGRELLHFVGQLFGLGRGERRQRASALLDRVGLADSADLALRRYSKGMLQRVGLAQALINDPELVILDEPMSGLDPLGRKEVREIIAGLRGEGKTVVFSSHILSDVELLADHAAIVVKGRTVDAGPLHELVDAKVLSIDVEVAGVGDELAAELRDAGHAVQLRGDRAVITVGEGAALDAVIDRVRAQSGCLLAVTPRKESLEDVVVREVTRDDARGAR